MMWMVAEGGALFTCATHRLSLQYSMSNRDVSYTEKKLITHYGTDTGIPLNSSSAPSGVAAV